MKLRVIRIANTTVADEYQAASAKVDALYRDLDIAESPAMRQLRQEHRRMLANGWCTRPKETDCAFESICEGCGFFSTSVEFKPTLQAQRDHAAANGQIAREERYTQLLNAIEEPA